MRLAILSDTHGNLAMVGKALHILEKKNIDLILHCGDIDDEETIQLFSANTHFVFGNCDLDHDLFRDTIQSIRATLHKPYGHLEIDGKNIAFVHGDDHILFRDLERSGAYDFLFYGHTHVAKEHRTGPTRIINPGALHRARPKTFVILELPLGEIESVVVE